MQLPRCVDAATRHTWCYVHIVTVRWCWWCWWCCCLQRRSSKKKHRSASIKNRCLWWWAESTVASTESHRQTNWPVLPAFSRRSWCTSNQTNFSFWLSSWRSCPPPPSVVLGSPLSERRLPSWPPLDLCSCWLRLTQSCVQSLMAADPFDWRGKGVSSGLICQMTRWVSPPLCVPEPPSPMAQISWSFAAEVWRVFSLRLKRS